MILPKCLSLSLAVIALCTATSVAAQELPTRKAGLWELKMTVASGQMPAMTMQQCTDATTDKEMSTMFGPMQKDMCSKKDVQQTSSGYVIDAVCSTSGLSMTSHSEINGDFNSGYTMKVTSQTSGGPSGAARSNTLTMEAKWLGACTAGQKAGDIIMPGGRTINVMEIEKMQGMMKKPTAPPAPR